MRLLGSPLRLVSAVPDRGSKSYANLVAGQPSPSRLVNNYRQLVPLEMPTRDLHQTIWGSVAALGDVAHKVGESLRDGVAQCRPPVRILRVDTPATPTLNELSTGVPAIHCDPVRVVREAVA